jgi:HlyD family secretion protein
MNEQARLPDLDVSARLGLPAPRRRSRVRTVAVLALITLTVSAGAAGYFVLRGDQAPAYVTAPVVSASLVVTVSATGTLQPETQVDVGAEISGRVDRVDVDFNDRVSKGQVLALINTDQIRAQLAQAKAELGAAQASVITNEATVKETKERRDRAEGLFGRGIVSQQDFQTAEADYARAVASVAKAKADVENASARVQLHETSLDKAAVRSPIDGMVLERRVQPGQTVAASFQTPVLFTLASDLSRMELEVDIDEADIGHVREGQTATFSVDAFPQRRFDATLVSLRNAPKTTNGVVTYQGVLAVDNGARLLRPGLTATADILVAQSESALLVPNGALRFTPPPSQATTSPLTLSTSGALVGRVWVLEENTPVPRDLKIGHSDGRSTEVLSGNLKAGESVITDITGSSGAPPP